MPDRLYTNSEKLYVVESLLQEFRPFRSDPAAPENQTYRVLKQIAKEIRIADAAVHQRALVVLSEKMAHAEEGKNRFGHSIVELQTLAWALMEHWPEVKRALESQSA